MIGVGEAEFNHFKAAVAALEFTPDLVELDRRLGEISTELYDLRRAIDDIWRSARAARLRRPQHEAVKAAFPRLTDEEILLVIAEMERAAGPEESTT